MPKIKVYAKEEIAFHRLLNHPGDGQMRVGGSYWEHDTWTHNLLKDGAITRDASEEWRAQATPSAPPAPKEPLFEE